MAEATAAPAPATSTTATTPVAPESSTPVVAAPATDSTPTTPTSTQAPTASDAPAAPAVTEGSAPTDKPLFTIPETVKLAPEATQKFETFLRSKLTTDGKVTLTSQEVLDQFLEQAKDANERWAKQVQDTDKANETACKARFTPAQLAASEMAVGFASSLDPSFRDFAKRQLNDPVFVNFMREIGERLSEDTFEHGSPPPPTASKKSAAERMGYVRKPN